MSGNSGNGKYKNIYNVLRNGFLTKAEAARNNATLKLTTNILKKGKRHPLVKAWVRNRTSRNERPYNFLTRRSNLWRNKKHSNFFNEKINMNKYDTVLGSGGFGMIVSNTSGKNVVKLFYKEDTCGEMRKEYLSFTTAYNALEDYPLIQLAIPEPKKIDNKSIEFKDSTFQCGIEMEKITPVPSMVDKNNGIVHIILKEDYKSSGMMNKEVGRRYGKEISKNNPSRGFFATGSYIESDILPQLSDVQKGGIVSLDDIAYRMGYGFALLVSIAELYPNDVEYCLGIINGVLNVIIMDFGMCSPIDYSSNSADKIAEYIIYGIPNDVYGTGISSDFYFPENTDPMFNKFIEGINSIKVILNDEKKILILNTIISKLTTG